MPSILRVRNGSFSFRYERKGKTIELTDFSNKPNDCKLGICRYCDYTLTIKAPCFKEVGLVSTSECKLTHQSVKPYFAPKINLCIHTNPHNKIQPVGRIPRPYQGGSVTSR